MRIRLMVVFACLIGMVLLLPAKSGAVMIFNQDFTSSSTVGDYVSATPDSGQVDDISTDGSISSVSISSNQLAFDMVSTGSAGMLRSTELTDPVMSVMDLELVYTYSADVTGSSGPGPDFQIGDYPASATNYTSGGASNDRFGNILWRKTGGTYRLETGGAQVNGLAYGSEHVIRFLLNDSGVSQDYLGPDGFAYTLNHHATAVFLDDTLVVNNGTVSPGVANADLSTFRFRAVDADREFSINSLTIQDNLPALPPPPVPEPSALVLLLGMLGVIAQQQRKARARFQS